MAIALFAGGTLLRRAWGEGLVCRVGIGAASGSSKLASSSTETRRRITWWYSTKRASRFERSMTSRVIAWALSASVSSVSNSSPGTCSALNSEPSRSSSVCSSTSHA